LNYISKDKYLSYFIFLTARCTPNNNSGKKNWNVKKLKKKKLIGRVFSQQSAQICTSRIQTAKFSRAYLKSVSPSLRKDVSEKGTQWGKKGKIQ